jgi:hypothetical protein
MASVGAILVIAHRQGEYKIRPYKEHHYGGYR